eukprot:9508188-Lingulodinium_polyedra.AAC.1
MRVPSRVLARLGPIFVFVARCAARLYLYVCIAFAYVCTAQMYSCTCCVQLVADAAFRGRVVYGRRVPKGGVPQATLC